MELLWRNGQVVLHSQTQKKPGTAPNQTRPFEKHDQTMLKHGGSCGNWNNLIQEEEESISWIQCPMEDTLEKELCSNLFIELPPHDPIQSDKLVRHSEEENPMPPPKFQVGGSVQHNCCSPGGFGKIVNFSNFSLPLKHNLGSRGGDAKEGSVITVGLSHCGSNQVGTEGDLSLFSSSGVGTGCLSSGHVKDNVMGLVSQQDKRQTETLEPTVTSSSGGGSGSSFGRPCKQSGSKRKGREAEDSECQSEVLLSLWSTTLNLFHLSLSLNKEFLKLALQAAEQEYGARNNESQRSRSTRRSRAAEVHNLSERVGCTGLHGVFLEIIHSYTPLFFIQKRRDRINEKMRALQELIPHSNKVCLLSQFSSFSYCSNCRNASRQ